MNSVTTFKTSTTGPAATKSLGARIGRQLKGGAVIELAGDIGAGKTTFLNGLLSGLGFEGTAPSPTYTISRIYPLPKQITLHHFDFYRLHGHDITTAELAETLADPHAIVAVEWAGNMDNILPADRLQIELRPGASEDARDISVRALGPWHSGVVEALQ